MVSAPRGKSHAQPQLRQPLIVTRPDRLQMLIGVSQMSNGLQRKILHPRSQRTSKPVTEWCRKTLLSTVKVDPRKPRFQQPTQHRLARPLDGRCSLSIGQRPSGGVNCFGQERGANFQSRIHGRPVHLDQQIAWQRQTCVATQRPRQTTHITDGSSMTSRPGCMRTSAAHAS